MFSQFQRCTHISLYELPSGDLKADLVGHKIAVWSLRFINGGAQLVSKGYEGVINFWDLKTLEIFRSLDPKQPKMRGVVISQDEKVMAVSMEGKVQLWSLGDLGLQSELVVGTKVVNGMAFSPDGAWMAVGAADRKIRIYKR